MFMRFKNEQHSNLFSIINFAFIAPVDVDSCRDP